VKYYVLKIEDMQNALPTEIKDVFIRILHSIRKYRQALGKNKNSYLVVNIDEPYAVEIFNIMHRHGHTPCDDCLSKESSACDDKCVWSELYKDAQGVPDAK